MRLSIEHKTGFRYSTKVKSSYNEARMTPTSSPTQSVWGSRVTIAPEAWSFTYSDYWETWVTAFEVHQPHDQLTVHAEAVVETRGDDLTWDTDRRVAGNDLGWPALRDRGVVDSMTEYLTVNDRTAPPEEVRELARQVADQPPRLAALDICRQIAERLSYARGSTPVNAKAVDVWAGGKGVCQDFSHLTLGALRSVGLPARYVSGYLHPGGDGKPNTMVEGESHSWIEWWCGTWVAYDPTLLSRISENHVPVGHGRDYGDVAPLRGTYSGGPSQMFVTVQMTQLG